MAASPVSSLTRRSSLQVARPSAQAPRVAPPGQAELSKAAQAEFVICEYTIERLINQLKQFRRVATRYEKLAEHYVAMVTLAAILLWIK